MLNNTISIRSFYGESASAQNNAKVVTVAGVDFYFSYETLVAVGTGKEVIVRKNIWGTTTGKHLNMIDGGSKEAKKDRLDEDEFKNAFEEMDLPETIKELFDI